MDYQGARRTRSATGARQQASWPSSDDPGYELDAGQGTAPRHAMSPGSGPQRTLGSGPQQVLASGPQRVLGSGSGAQAALGRTPVRGFPPVNPGPSGPPAPPGAPGAPGRDQPESPREDIGPWHTPGTPYAGEDGTYAAGYGYAGEDEDDGQYRPGEPIAVAAMTPVTRRHGARTAPRTAAPKTAAPRRRGRAAWLALAAVVVVAAGGFAGYKYFYEPRVNAPVPSTLRLPTTAPGSPSFNKALGTWQHIRTRAEDPAPLTLTELYPPRFTLNGASYTRTAASVSKDCTLAVYGSQLQSALQSGHCTQLLRASYISGDGTMMGTVGVANLSTSGAAETAGHATGPQQILAPLSSQKGPTSKLGTGTGVVQAEIKGHYLILMWAEFTSLKPPSTPAQRQVLEQFAANLVTGSANINLSSRMVGTK